MEEKNSLTQELEKTRKIAEELQNEKTEIVKELGKARLEIDNVKRQMLQQEIAFNIQQTDALTRSLSPNVVDPGSFSRSASHSSFDTHSLPRRGVKRPPMDDDSTKVLSYFVFTIQHPFNRNQTSNDSMIFVIFTSGLRSTYIGGTRVGKTATSSCSR